MERFAESLRGMLKEFRDIFPNVLLAWRTFLRPHPECEKAELPIQSLEHLPEADNLEDHNRVAREVLKVCATLLPAL